MKNRNLEYPSVPHRPPPFNISVPHKYLTFSAPKIPQFHTKNPAVPHQKLLGSTPKTPQFHTPLCGTDKDALRWDEMKFQEIIPSHHIKNTTISMTTETELYIRFII